MELLEQATDEISYRSAHTAENRPIVFFSTSTGKALTQFVQTIANFLGFHFTANHLVAAPIKSVMK